MTNSFKTVAELHLQLGEHLRALRISRSVSQQELAAKAGVSVRALQKLEAGQGSQVETLIRYLKGLESADVLDRIAPRPTVSPLALLSSGRDVPRRVRRPRGPREAAPQSPASVQAQPPPPVPVSSQQPEGGAS